MHHIYNEPIRSLPSDSSPINGGMRTPTPLIQLTITKSCLKILLL